MAELKPETIAKVRDLLKFDVDDRKDRMLKIIECGYDNGLDIRIAEYRTAYQAYCNFDDLADELEG